MDRELNVKINMGVTFLSMCEFLKPVEFIPLCNRRYTLVYLFILCISCTEPVQPEFQFEEDLIFIDAIASTAPGASSVIINRSVIEFGVYGVQFVTGATVRFVNANNGLEVVLNEAGESYIPPADFSIGSGEEWKLNVSLPNGNVYESTPELVLQSVPINDIKVEYDPEITFLESEGELVPGHGISVSFDDPANEENYYYWSYRSLENLVFCAKCFDGVFRDGECIPFDITFLDPYFDYTCEIDCWRIRFPTSITIFADEFSDGKTISNLKIGDAPLYTKENMVIELQQFSLTPAAYQYFKVLKDIVDDNSGLNAPPPAALIGNLSNPNNPDEFVFGRFTAAATSVVSVFVERENISENQIEPKDPIITEPTIQSPYPPPSTFTAPCIETKFRTTVRPPSWIDN